MIWRKLLQDESESIPPQRFFTISVLEKCDKFYKNRTRWSIFLNILHKACNFAQDVLDRAWFFNTLKFLKNRYSEEPQQFFTISVLEKCDKFYKNRTRWSIFLNIIAGLKSAILLKNVLHRAWFFNTFWNFSRTTVEGCFR